MSCVDTVFNKDFKSAMRRTSHSPEVGQQAVLIIGLIFAICTIYTVPVQSYSDWVEGTPAMPHNYGMVTIGFSSTTIWLHGGFQYNYNLSKRLVSFDVDSHNLTDYGDILPTAAASFAQSYAQIGEYLYYVSTDANTLSRFNVDTGIADTSFSTPLADGAHTYDTPTEMCVMATPTSREIYVVGGNAGSAVLNTAYVLDVDAVSWSSVSNLPIARSSAGCIVSTDGSELFVVGGQGSGWLDSVEVMNVQTMQWSTLDDTLNSPLAWTRVIRDPSSPNLLVLGGYIGDMVSTVHIIDSVTHRITVSAGSLDIGHRPTGRHT